MKIHTPAIGNAPESPRHLSFNSPGTVRYLSEKLAELRHKVAEFEADATSCRQDVQERQRGVETRTSRLVELEREAAQVREERDRFAQLAQERAVEADHYTAQQADLDLVIRDLETLLSTYAPSALASARPAMPSLNGAPPVNGTGPHAMPANQTMPEGR
ncbi:hypothetical protein [Spirillospora sp. CA-294931]|uniref:hypothetical protein n=1 Tax=Spirillospora sp. CA-294931 TaxID=3240042 RepID=UPI003D8B9846